MLNTLTVINYLGEAIELDLRSPEKSGLLIRSITGLGPAKADINITDLTTTDGGLFNSSRLQTRNIVITLAFLFNPTVEDSRQLSYKFFPIKRPIRLLFETTNRKAYIDGYVESNDPDIFSQQESTKISVICPNPYFRSVEDGSEGTKFSAIEAMFESPAHYESSEFVVDGWSNEDTESPLIEFGIIQPLKEQVVEYFGDSETGMIMTAHATGTVQNLVIYNTQTSEQIKIDTDKLHDMIKTYIISGDDVVINTMRGNKSAYLIRNGESINILNCLDKNSDWFQLSRGVNIFSYSADSGSLNVQFKMEYPILYEGI